MNEKKCYRRIKIVLWIFLLLAMFTWIVLTNFAFEVFKPEIAHNVPYKKAHKVILVYTPFFGYKTWSNIFKDNCRYDHIILSFNRSNFVNSDVVIFHSRDMPGDRTLASLRRSKPKESGQLWIYFSMESYRNNPPINVIDRYFDLVSTYRLNSDVRIPYGEHSKLTSDVRIPYGEHSKLTSDVGIPYGEHSKLTAPSTRTFIDYSKGKKNAVAWIVSNCYGHQRNRLVEKLISDNVSVHVSGGCSSKFKNKFSCQGDCSADIQKYKFYLAAENTLCEDYVTEKYWNALRNNVIPIVLGGSDYSNPLIAIPGSFIDALNFQSPKHLAEYLKQVMCNNSLYNSYFNWKYMWKLSDEGYYCRLCRTISHRKPTKPSYNRLKQTISEDQCTRPEIKFSSWIDT